MLCWLAHTRRQSADQLPHRRGGNDVFRFNGLLIASPIFVCDGPVARRFIVGATRYPAAHLKLTAQHLDFFGARFPHHSGTFPWIAEGIDQQFNYLRSISVVVLRNQGILDGTAQRKSFDPLRSPIGGDFLATHSPNLFGVTFEECVEQAFAKLIAYPLFEIAWVSCGQQARFQPRKNTDRGPEDTQLEQGLDRS